MTNPSSGQPTPAHSRAQHHRSPRRPGFDDNHDSNVRIIAATEHALLSALPRRSSPRALAEAVGVCLANLHFAYRSVRGVPLYSALLQLRLDAADRLLQAGANRPQEAAIQCGFTHYGAFERNYRVRFGRTPSSADPGAKSQPRFEDGSKQPR